MQPWPFDALVGWPLMRGIFYILENTNAMTIWPHNPGGRWRGGPYKRVTSVPEDRANVQLEVYGSLQ